MNKLQLPQAKLLYAIAELYRKRRIDETEKRMLKGNLKLIQKRSSLTMSRFMNYWNKMKIKLSSMISLSILSAPKNLKILCLKMQK